MKVTSLRTFAKMYPNNEFSDRLEDKIDISLEGIQYMAKDTNRALVAFAHLVTGEQTPCPKLVWFVPQKRTVRGGTKGLKDAFFRETAVYFLCENSYVNAHDDPILMNFGRKGVKYLLPLMKLSLLTLKMEGARTLGLPFPLPDLLKLSEQIQYLEDLIREVLFEDETLQSMQQTLQAMEVWFYDIVEKGESRMDGKRVAGIKKLISSSYAMLSPKALKEQNVSKWKPYMTTQIEYDDKGNACKIKWVKL